MDRDAPLRYLYALKDLKNNTHVSKDLIRTFKHFASVFYRVDSEDKFATPTSWNGLYTGAVSLLCILLLVADLLHGLRTKKYWFPFKYLTMHSHKLSLIAIALKIAQDCTTPMPGLIDKATKVGGLAFMCSLVASSLPSLASINREEGARNIMSLGTTLSALVFGVIIQIKSGVLTYDRWDRYIKDLRNVFPDEHFDNIKHIPFKFIFDKLAAVYVILIVLLYGLCISSYLENLKTKKIMDAKYKQKHERVSSEQRPDRLAVLGLGQHVRKYGIMAGTGSPQFVAVCSNITSACGVICVLSTCIHIYTFVWTIYYVVIDKVEYESGYKKSVLVVYIIQFIGVILGAVAPLCRCFRLLCFRLSAETLKKHKRFKAKGYSVQTLDEWKRRIITLSFRSHKTKVITHYVKNVFLWFYIVFQKALQVVCYIIDCIPFLVVCSVYWLKCLKDNEQPRAEPENQHDDVLRLYVLQLEDNMDFSPKFLERLNESTTRWIESGERRRPKHLLDLIRVYRRHEEFAQYQVTALALLSNEDPSCWSLPVVTLTSIAIALPGIHRSRVYRFLQKVREGLKYVTVVEECINTLDHSLKLQKAATMLWGEIEVRKTWLGYNMKTIVSDIHTTRGVLDLFMSTSEGVVTEMQLDDGSGVDFISKLMCVNSMISITNKILNSTIINHEFGLNRLFDHLTKMIVGLLVECYTRLPEAIVLKCHTQKLEKREATVKAVAKLLGETSEIINVLEDYRP